MKKYITIICLSILCLTGVVWAKEYAQDEEPPGLLWENFCITTYTSEPCGIAGEGGFWQRSGSDGKAPRYKCQYCGSDAFVGFIGNIYKYIFFICLVLGVLFMVLMGVGLSVSGVGSENMKEMAKSRIVAILTGLLALAMIPWLLKTVAPFFFQ